MKTPMLCCPVEIPDEKKDVNQKTEKSPKRSFIMSCSLGTPKNIKSREKVQKENKAREKNTRADVKAETEAKRKKSNNHLSSNKKRIYPAP